MLIPGDRKLLHPGRIIPWKETRYLGAGLEWSGKSRPDRVSKSDRSARGEELYGFC